MNMPCYHMFPDLFHAHAEAQYRRVAKCAWRKLLA
jgi:hypothetical protein